MDRPPVICVIYCTTNLFNICSEWEGGFSEAQEEWVGPPQEEEWDAPPEFREDVSRHGRYLFTDFLFSQVSKLKGSELAKLSEVWIRRLQRDSLQFNFINCTGLVAIKGLRGCDCPRISGLDL